MLTGLVFGIFIGIIGLLSYFDKLMKSVEEIKKEIQNLKKI